MPLSAPETSVVVSTYDEKRWTDLEACLRSLEAQTRPPLEVIVVVDHNPSLLAKTGAAFPDHTVVANRRPRGLAGARNAGTNAARGEIVAFIDDDARAEPGWLEQIESCFQDQSVVGAGGALIPRWDSAEPRWFPPEFYWVFGCSYTGLPERRAPVRNPIGANMAVRASVLAEVNGFREGSSEDAPREIRARGVVRAAGNVPDDTDLAIRVNQLLPDAVWLYEPRAEVLHTVTSERTSIGYFVRRCYEEGNGKARLAGSLGAEQSLSSERRHVARVLPAGFVRGLGDLLRGDAYGVLRAAAIVLGATVTAAGFVTATWAIRLSRRK